MISRSAKHAAWGLVALLMAGTPSARAQDPFGDEPAAEGKEGAAPSADQAEPGAPQDQGSGASSSLGGRGNCFKWSFPVGINAKYVIKATRGQGVIASQLYSK